MRKSIISAIALFFLCGQVLAQVVKINWNNKIPIAKKVKKTLEAGVSKFQAEYSCLGPVLTFSDSNMSDLKTMNDEIYPIMAFHQRLVLNDDLDDQDLSLEEIQANECHELFHSMTPDTVTKIPEFEIFKGYTIFAKKGLTLKMKDSTGKTFDLIIFEEGAAHVTGYKFTKKKYSEKYPQYEKLRLYTQGMIDSGWFTIKDLIYAEKNSNINFIFGKILNKKPESITPADMRIIIKSCFSNFFEKKSEIDELREKIKNIRYPK